MKTIMLWYLDLLPPGNSVQYTQTNSKEEEEDQNEGYRNEGLIGRRGVGPWK